MPPLPPPPPPLTSLLRHRPPFLFLSHITSAAPPVLTAALGGAATSRPALLDALGQAAAALLRLTPAYAAFPTPVFVGMDAVAFAPPPSPPSPRGRGGAGHLLPARWEEGGGVVGVCPITVLVRVELLTGRRRYGVVAARAYVPASGDDGCGEGKGEGGAPHDRLPPPPRPVTGTGAPPLAGAEGGDPPVRRGGEGEAEVVRARLHFSFLD